MSHLLYLFENISNASTRFYFLFLGMLVIQLITVYFFFPETRGATLEEMNQTFGGSEAVEAMKTKGHELDAFTSSSHQENVDGKEGADFGVTHLTEYAKGDSNAEQLRLRRPSADVRNYE